MLYKVAMSGFLEFESSADLFEKNHVAVDIMIDVLTDRGALFHPICNDPCILHNDCSEITVFSVLQKARRAASL